MKGFSGFKSSPAKQGEIFDPNDPKQMEALKKIPKSKKTYPKSYTKKDIEFLKEQREDVVRYEDLDAKGKKIWDALNKPIPGKKSTKKQSQSIKDYKEIMELKKKEKKSPAKQEGPLPEENIKLQKGEHPDTWIYPGKDKFERITDYEDRAEFAREDAFNTEGEEKKKHLANAKKLQHEADILRNRKPKKK